MTNHFTKNQILTGLVDGMSSEALGVVHLDGRAIFVPRALPGEEWELRIVKVTNTAVFARGERLLSAPSPARIEPACPFFGKCGGCDCLHMDYAEELRFKRERVDAALRHIGKQKQGVREILGSKQTEYYRNKAIFAVGDRGGALRFGFYRERSHELLPVERCLIQSPLSCRCAAAVTEFMAREGIPAYDETSGKGVVRHVFCREARKTRDAVCCIVAARGFGARTDALVSHLRERCPELTGIVLNINKTRGNTVLAGEFYPLWGEPTMRDELLGLSFRIAPQAFFQVNPPQAERLYTRAMEYAAADGAELALDLYCGAGTISLCLARHAKRVIGAEIVPQAVENAAENAAYNHIENAEFICADAGEAAAQLARRELRPEVVLVDPPRKGMDEAAVRAVGSMQPARIVYVSCDPATLARDILRFNGLGYVMQEATAVDMFPRTRHVETVVLLSRK